MTATDPARLLPRPEYVQPLPALEGQRVVVTGGDGYLGTRVQAALVKAGAEAVSYDAPLDVLDYPTLRRYANGGAWCIHLAAHKHAPAGEDHPAVVADLNIRGTEYAARAFDGRVVVASTCKAADPATVYGASKLIAERIALNAGGRVVRLVNVLGSTGSVLDLWSRVPDSEPLPVTADLRMWMTPREATHLLVAALRYHPGRYALTVGEPEPVAFLARAAYGPDRAIEFVPSRRGDRERERLLAEYETALTDARGVVQIRGPFDAEAAETAPHAPPLAA